MCESMRVSSLVVYNYTSSKILKIKKTRRAYKKAAMHGGKLHYFLFLKFLSQNFEICLGVKLKFIVFSLNKSVQTERVINIVPAGNNTN